jgi:sulfhydrogenase subunit gamma (sulfur reductase)
MMMTNKNTQVVYLPYEAEIIFHRQDLSDVFTFFLKFTDHKIASSYQFLPGQFNMVYLFGVGEVPITIISDPNNNQQFQHTIRKLGHVTNGLSLLKQGDRIGIRGPFGQGWPLKQAKGKDVLIVTGGLGCAPSVSAIHHIIKHRDDFGRLTILQGVKHSSDLIFRQQYEAWAALPNTQVLLAASVSKPGWPWHTGIITELLEKAEINATNAITMMCGPEGMMLAVIDRLLQMKFPESALYLNLERNMECAVGHCGHCQFGGQFICKDGPVLWYPDIKNVFGRRDF